MDAYPMQKVDDMIDRAGGAKFISALDLTKGHWQVLVQVEDHDYHTSRPVPICSTIHLSEDGR